MSHEITILEDGTAEAAFAVQPAWHGLGETVDHAMSSEEAMSSAHLGWLVKQYPVYKKMEDGSFLEVRGWKTNTRSDNYFDLGLVKNNYKVVQNAVAFQVMDSLLMDGILKYESAFSLNGGKDVVLLARLPEVDKVVDGDLSHRYLLMVLNHAGLKCIQFLPTSVRVVCANTKRMALEGGKGQIIKVRHTGDMDAKLSDAREALLQINAAFTNENSKAQKMSRVKVSREAVKDYLDFLYPMPSITDEDYSDRRRKKGLETRRDILWNYLEDDAQQLDGIRETAWSLFNSVTQYEDHRNYRGGDAASKAETRFKSVILKDDIKQKAWSYWDGLVSAN